MITFLKELWLAKHAYIDLRGDLKRVRRIMFAIPPANRSDVVPKVIEKLRSRGADMPVECSWTISAAEQDEMIQMQQSFETFAAEQVDVISNRRIKKLVRRKHVLPHGVIEVITPTTQHCIDGREMALNITQFILNASKS
jgi:hypothetical protein